MGKRLGALLVCTVLGLTTLGVAAPASAASTPALYSCSHVAHRRPANFQIACGDGNGYFDQAVWTSWNARQAKGTARQWANTCTPDCAAGNYVFRRVSITLYRPATLDFQRYFSRILVGGSNAYRAYRASLPVPRRGCASVAEYNRVRRGYTAAQVARIFGTTGIGNSTHRGYRACTQYPGSPTVYAEVWYRNHREIDKHWSDD